LTDLNVRDGRPACRAASVMIGARRVGRRVMTDVNDKRAAAIRRLEAKRAFNLHATIYVAVNVLLIAIWAITGGRYFWPIWPILGWGVAVAIHYWMVFKQKPITEDDIRREMERDG
jgi:hypothetical protein